MKKLSTRLTDLPHPAGVTVVVIGIVVVDEEGEGVVVEVEGGEGVVEEDEGGNGVVVVDDVGGEAVVVVDEEGRVVEVVGVAVVVVAGDRVVLPVFEQTEVSEQSTVPLE